MYLTQGLHRAVQQFPQRIATICGERQRTFTELHERVAKLAAALRAHGMQTGACVAVLGVNSDRYLETCLAVVWGGGVINPVNIRWSDAEIIYSLDDSDAAILIVDDQFTAAATRIRERCRTLKHIVHAGDTPTAAGMLAYEQLIAEAAPMEDVRRSGDELAGLFYTGGTTGFPKGVMLSHNNIVIGSLTLIAQGVMPADAIFLHAAPMFHIGDFAQLVAQLIRGGTHVIIPGFNPLGMLEAISRNRVTDTMLVPTMIQMLVDHPQVGEFDLRSLRQILFGAAPMSPALIERAQTVLPNVVFLQAYGMTEAAPTITVNPSYYYSREGRALGKMASVGRAAYSMELRIVDEDDRDVAVGEVGEILLRGANIMRGYWKKPKETADAMRGGWLHTGDAAYMDEDGFVFLVDRIKDMIITGGENVYSTEVENAIAQHHAVATCAVIGIPHEQWGETVHAVVVLKNGHTLIAEELIVHCKTLIAGYKCPRSVEFRDALPLSGAGKMLKAALREPFWKDKNRRV